jgi:hypothetical protein
MCSPVFSKALGECNAIRSWGFGHSELTLSASGKPISTLPVSSFLDNFRLADYSPRSHFTTSCRLVQAYWRTDEEEPVG